MIENSGDMYEQRQEGEICILMEVDKRKLFATKEDKQNITENK
jgi:hypothetical protein